MSLQRLQSLNNYDNFNPPKNFSIEGTLYEKYYSAMRYDFSSQSYTPRVFLTSYSTLSNFPFHHTLSNVFGGNRIRIIFTRIYTWQRARAIAVAIDTNEHGPNLHAAKSTQRARSRNNSLPRGSIGWVRNRYLEAFLSCPAIHS